MSKPNKKLILTLTDEQVNSLKKFLRKHKIMCDGKTGFGLIAEPKIYEEELVVRLLTVPQCNKINKFFDRMKLKDEQ